jgi:hypothetical protein
MALDTALAVGSVSIQGNSYSIYGTLSWAREYFAAKIGGET